MTSRRKVRIVATGSLARMRLGEHLRAIGIDTDEIERPFEVMPSVTRQTIEDIDRKLHQGDGAFTIHMPGTAELFVDADLTITYSAYRSWFDPERFTVVPHLWTPNGEAKDLMRLRWRTKPPLKVGFMGNSWASSTAAQFALLMPESFQRAILRGEHLRTAHHFLKTRWMGRTYMLNAARIRTLRVIRQSTLPQDIRITEFAAKPHQLADYQEHMHATTYVLCPRGTENYSFRFYEALSCGRVPVLIDTDMVLPDGVDWEKLCVRVPYDDIDNLARYIEADYERRSATDFIERQELQLATMSQLRTLAWVGDLATTIGQRLAQKVSTAM